MCFYAKDDFDGPAQEIIQVKQGTVMAFDGRTTLHEGRLDSEVSTFLAIRLYVVCKHCKDLMPVIGLPEHITEVEKEITDA